MNTIKTGKDKGRVLRWLRDNWPRIEKEGLTQVRAAQLASSELSLEVSVSRFDHIRSLLIGMGYDDFAVWPTQRGRVAVNNQENRSGSNDMQALAKAVKHLYESLDCPLTDLGRVGHRIMQLSEQD
jgi:hypothetical protein